MDKLQAIFCCPRKQIVAARVYDVKRAISTPVDVSNVGIVAAAVRVIGCLEIIEIDDSLYC